MKTEIHKASNILSEEGILSLAKALTYMDIERLDMGDSPSENPEFLCWKAGIEFDRDCADENEYYYEEVSIEAYKKIIADESIHELIESIVEENYDHMDYIRNVMLYTKSDSADVMEHPTLKAICTIDAYIQSINDESVCDNEHCKKMTEIKEYLSAIDIKVCYAGSAVGNKFFRYLNPENYFISNTFYTVGHIPDEENPELNLGDYAIHATVLSHLRKKGSDQGYTVAFKRKNENIVAHIYRFTKELDPYSMTHEDTGCELVVNTEDLEGFSEVLANKINEFTESDFVNTVSKQENEGILKRRGR